MIPNLKYQLWLLVLLQVLDGSLTYAAITKYNDVFIEANPAALWLAAHTDIIFSLIVFKTTSIILGMMVYCAGKLKGLMMINYICFIVVIVNTLVLMA